VRQSLRIGAAAVFGAEAALYGLDKPLTAEDAGATGG
jgi:hypothetical protein